MGILGLSNTILHASSNYLSLPALNLDPPMSVNLDGANDFIQWGDMGDVKAASIWMRPNSTHTKDTDPVRFMGIRASQYYGFHISDNTSLFDDEVMTTKPGANSRTASTTNLPAGEWVHFMFVWLSIGGDAGYYLIYINGVISTQNNSNNGSTDDYLSWNQVRVGRDNSAEASENWGGRVDEFATWSSFITAAEVLAIYNNGNPIDVLSDQGNYASSDDLTHYYKMNEGSGTAVADSKGSVDGTLFNGPTWISDDPND
tara:strand:+ start:1115 stop:1888 length:774 start_codon:yes stop_codon:yes gene_type:complete